jgi:hypothetical protein
MMTRELHRAGRAVSTPAIVTGYKCAPRLFSQLGFSCRVSRFFASPRREALLPALQLFFLFGFFCPIALGALKAIVRLTVHKSLLSFAIVSKSMAFAVAPSAHHLAVFRKFGAFVHPPSAGRDSRRTIETAFPGRAFMLHLSLRCADWSDSISLSRTSG